MSRRPSFGAIRSALAHNRPLPPKWRFVPGATRYVQDLVRRDVIPVTTGFALHWSGDHVTALHAVPHYHEVPLPMFKVELDLAPYLDGFAKLVSDQTEVPFDTVARRIAIGGLGYRNGLAFLNFVRATTIVDWTSM